MCVCAVTAACRRLTGTTAAASDFFLPALPSSSPPPHQQTEGSDRRGDRRNPTPGFPFVLGRSTSQQLTAPGGRAGSMIAAQLLAYYFTELKDDQLKRVSGS